MLDYDFCPYDGNKLVREPSEHEGMPWCSQCGFVHYPNPKPAVAVFVLRDKRVLVAQRGIAPAQGEWDIPGGFLQWGESAEDASIRECQEELSVEIRIIDFLGSLPDIYGPRKIPTLNLCFVAEIQRGEPRPQSDVEKLKWIKPSSPPRGLAFSHQVKAFEWLNEWIRANRPDMLSGL